MAVKQVLRECQVFSALGEAEIEQIANLSLEKQYDAGTTIFQEGDSAEELFIIQEGKVAVQMTLPNGQGPMVRRITVDIVTGNEVVGWSAIIEPYLYTLTVVCVQKVRVLSINGSKFRWLLQNDHNIGYAVMGELIKVVALRLGDTRRVLASERVLTGVR